MVWKLVPAQCTRLLVTTDGFADDPEMEFFFKGVEQSDTAASILADHGGTIPRECIYHPLDAEVRESDVIQYQHANNKHSAV